MHWTPETWTQCLFLILLWQRHRSSWLGSSSSWQSKAGRFSVACKNFACLWRVSPDMRSRRFSFCVLFYCFFLPRFTSYGRTIIQSGGQLYFWFVRFFVLVFGFIRSLVSEWRERGKNN